LQLVSKTRDPRYWKAQDYDGDIYIVGNRELSTGFKLMTEGQLQEGWLSNTILTGAMILAMFKASGQNADKVVNTIQQSNKEVQMTPQELSHLEKVTGIKWGEKIGNKLFSFSPDSEAEKSTPREFPPLNLGIYKEYLKVANVSSRNHQVDGDLEYTVDISDKSYLKSDLFDDIKKNNPDLRGAEINFTIKGTPLRGYTIKL
jgi:hypothetical protein